MVVMTGTNFQMDMICSGGITFSSADTVQKEDYSGNLNPVSLLAKMEKALDYLTGGTFYAEEAELESGSDSFLVSVTTADPILPPEEAPKKRGRKARQKTSEEIAEAERAALERRLGKDGNGRRRRQVDPTTCERDYSDDEVEFMKAIDFYKRSNGRMFPTCSETLEVLRNLGYVKMPRGDESSDRSAVLFVHNLYPGFSEDSVIAGLGWDETEVVVFWV